MCHRLFDRWRIYVCVMPNHIMYSDFVCTVLDIIDSHKKTYTQWSN